MNENESTNVRHTVIARVTKDTGALCSQASSMLARLLKESRRDSSALTRKLQRRGLACLRGRKRDTRAVARNDRLIKKQRACKALERLVLLGGVAPLGAQDVITMKRHGSDEGISAHRLVGNLHWSGIGDSHRSLTRVEATLILLRS